MVFGLITAAHGEDSAPANKTGVAQPKPVAWIDSWDKGLVRARQNRRPILVRIEGADCPHCRRMALEIEQPDVQTELKRWTLIALDIDDAPEETQRLGAEKIPAFRVLTPAGKLVAASDGVIPAAEFLTWLKNQHDEAVAPPAAELTAAGEPDDDAVAALIEQFRHRDAAVREAAIRRLLPYPHLSAAPVVTAFLDGGLSTQLSAWELLHEWQAPLDGLDPWRKETFAAEKTQALTDWAGDVQPPEESARRERLTTRELAEAKELLQRLATSTASEAAAIRERLARYGASVLPLVYEQLQTAATDELRERLTAVRYRLVADDALVLHWPGGIDRLAATEAALREEAADELARRASPADERLLLELFSDTSPLVREISLRALKELGGESVQSALLRLLADPEPNVRAAVLKQLVESPSAAILPAIVKFARQETDPDLVVHAIRVLREIPGKAAHAALSDLLQHENWSVRAEAADALGHAVGRHSNLSEEDKVEIYVTMVGLLEDADQFVISRAIGVLSEADLVTAVAPLVKAAEAHPELAAEVVKALSQGEKQRHVAAVPLRKFCRHDNAKVRAAAIAGLCQMNDAEVDELLGALLDDPESDVRVAAATGLFAMLDVRRHQFSPAQTPQEMDDEMIVESSVTVDVAPGFWKTVFNLFAGDGGAEAARPVRKQAVAIVTEDDADSDDAPADAASPANADDADDSPYDEHLRRIRQGQLFSDEQQTLAKKLVPMLAQERQEERLAAAAALALLGQDADAIPALMSLADADPRLAAKLAAALPWLLPADRQALWDKLAARAKDSNDFYALVSTLSQIKSPQTERNLWRLASDERIDGAAAEALRSEFQDYYLGAYEYQPENLPQRMRRVAVQAATKHAESDSYWTKILALAILLSVDKDAAGELAQKIVENSQAAPQLRSDALQVWLLSLYDSAAEQAAVRHLSDEAEELRRIALKYLALGKVSISSLRQGQFTLRHDYFRSFNQFSASEPIEPEPPKGLTAEPLMPLLKSPDRQTAALAGYLLALLEQDEGLPTLLAYWEQEQKSHADWTRLVYRAIARLDDSSRIAILRQIFERWNNDRERQNLKEFYWTIRSMTGPEALALRKAIRDEVGVEQLK